VYLIEMVIHRTEPLKGIIMTMITNPFLKAVLIGVGLMGMLGTTACSTAPETRDERADLRQSAVNAVSQAQLRDPSLGNFIRNSAAYAVFPSIGKGAVGIGGAYGKGDVYQNGAAIGYCDMTQGTIGLALGGQAYTEILVFDSQSAIDRFKNGNFSFDAQATAVALKSGAGANAKFANGVAVFTMDEAGLMYEASIGGQKFSYQDR
jgi:lipid-binding SYLF domain-containing protein